MANVDDQYPIGGNERPNCSGGTEWLSAKQSLSLVYKGKSCTILVLGLKDICQCPKEGREPQACHLHWSVTMEILKARGKNNFR